MVTFAGVNNRLVLDADGMPVFQEFVNVTFTILVPWCVAAPVLCVLSTLCLCQLVSSISSLSALHSLSCGY